MDNSTDDAAHHGNVAADGRAAALPGGREIRLKILGNVANDVSGLKKGDVSGDVSEFLRLNIAAWKRRETLETLWEMYATSLWKYEQVFFIFYLC